MEPATIYTLSKAGLELSKQLPKLKSKIEMIVDYFKQGKLIIVILGPGGVGKTTLAKYLTGDDKYKNTGYLESTSDEDFKIRKNVIGKYWVAPGQNRRIKKYWPKIQRAIATGKVRAIIMVVSYGYHSIDKRLNYEHIGDVYEAGMTKSSFFKEYLSKNRETELTIIRELKPFIISCKERVHFMTLVTKQDLWWKEKDQVNDYYLNGKYNQEILEIQNHKGFENFDHNYMSLSLMDNNFSIGKDEFKLVAEGYDDNIQSINIDAFLNQLKAYFI